MERRQRRLAAILAADVAGYSRLMAADESGTLSRLNHLRSEIIEPTLSQYSGRIVGSAGDSLLVEFASAVDAVECAIDLQEKLAAENVGSPENKRMVFRMGVNLGDVIAEGSTIHGDGVNIASRLEKLAQPGGLCVSDKVHAEISGKIHVLFEDMGEKELKNISSPIRAYRTRTGAGADLPQTKFHSRDPSIAVLRFANLSGDPEQQYLSDGISEDIITELSRYHSLQVIARSSSFKFDGSTPDIEVVRRKLGVRYIVEGSVRKLGASIRVTAKLINAETASHLWAERYDRPIADIFAVQTEMAAAVAATLEGRIAAHGAEFVRKKPTADWDAYDNFLKGRELMYYFKGFEAEPYFARAVALDPNYVHAHAWRATALTFIYTGGVQQDASIIDAAVKSAQRALELDDTDAWAHEAMGYVSLRQRQLQLAGLHYDRAYSLNPNDLTIAGGRANWLNFAGRSEEALQCLDQAMQRDPFPPTWVWEVRGAVLYQLKRYDEAIAAYLKVGENPYWMSALLAAAYAQTGQLENARRALARLREIAPDVTLDTFSELAIYEDRSRTEHFLDGLRKAGLER